MKHRLILLLDGPPGERRVELVCEPAALAGAVVSGVRDLERDGRRVLRILPAAGQTGVIEAADLVLRLRRLTSRISEEEVAVLLELLPL